MTDMPPTAAAPGEPSEEEVRQYLAQMRGAPAEQVIAEVLQGLLNAAQVKLGRKDARLLLDLAADVTERAGPHLSADLKGQLNDVLTQLRMGQVEAEKEVTESGHDEPNDLQAAGTGASAAPAAGTPRAPDQAGAPSRPAAGQPAGGTPGAGGPPAGEQSPLDKLWIPGR